MGKHKRLSGSRKYTDYSNDDLIQAIRSVKAGVISMAKASKKYGIPIGTLHNKLTGKHSMKKAGGQTALSTETELELVRNIITCCDWGFPLTSVDVKMS